ncbi:MAG: metalloregulator ArsR/SmtB family transcription factor [Caulobacteraceae bacterium]|nr:metalloregulator ArsR/SmtB family transcription factor [Caulobacteraceae bacterium]
MSVVAPDIDRLLSALADPHRRGVIELLRRGPMRAGDLAGALSLSAQAMSRHLRTLRQTGLVAEGHDGPDARVRIYRLRPETLGTLKTWLDETEQLWSMQLAAFKSHVEVEEHP